MSLMDAVKEYNRLKSDKKIYLNKLDKELKELEKVRPDYKTVVKKIIKGLEKRLDVSFSDSYIVLDSKDFKVGDRVVGINNTCAVGNNKVPIKGLKGQIINSTGPFGSVDFVGVEFEKDIKGYDCWSRAKKGHGWWVPKSYLKKLVNKLSTDIKTQKEFKAFTNDLVERVVKASKERKNGVFKIGDQVRVREVSRYSDQRKHGVGIVKEDSNLRDGFEYAVEFETRPGTLLYRTADLEYAFPKKQMSKQDKSSITALVEKMVAEIEPDLKRYETKRREVVRIGVFKLRSFGFDDEYILNFFQKKLFDVSDVMEALK